MQVSRHSLFTLAVCEYFINGRNAFSGNISFSNSDFYRLASGLNPIKFKKNCLNKLSDQDKFLAWYRSIESFFMCNIEDVNEDIGFILPNYMYDIPSSADGILTPFDDNFPQILNMIKKNSEKPFLLFYRGNISLLSEINKNIAVIGVLNPEDDIKKRERIVVENIVKQGFTIVSGLANGCDAIAHETCLEKNGKTIAILPSTLSKIYPKENTGLANRIIENDGLLITEYYKPPLGKYDFPKRCIDRDRLQALFSKSIIMMASYRKGEGDSGSRHAMEKAKEYSTSRAILFDKDKDYNNPQFGLSKDYYESKFAKVLSIATLKELMSYNKYLPSNPSINLI